jgi:hypothetical protein
MRVGRATIHPVKTPGAKEPSVKIKWSLLFVRAVRVGASSNEISSQFSDAARNEPDVRDSRNFLKQSVTK